MIPFLVSAPAIQMIEVNRFKHSYCCYCRWITLSKRMINWLTFITFDGSRSSQTVWKCAQNRTDVNSSNIRIESAKKRVQLLMINWTTRSWPRRPPGLHPHLISILTLHPRWMTYNPKTYDIYTQDEWHLHPRPMTYNHQTYDIYVQDEWQDLWP